jgi:opacity protein-like surface antigen
MRKLLLLTTALTALAVPAMAADQSRPPLKAPPVTTAYPYDVAGTYWGLTTFASQTAVNVNAPGSNIGQASIIGGSIGVLAGWSTPINNRANFLAFEVSASAQNINGSTQQAAGVLSLKGPWRLEGIVKYGMPCANIAAYFPNLGGVLPTLPGLPAGSSVANNCHAYIGGGLAGEDISAKLNMNTGGSSGGSEWSTAAVLKTGQIWQMTNGSAVETFLEYESNGRTFGINSGAPKFTPSIQGQAHRIMAGVNFLL